MYITISVGNTDNRLTQQEWHEFTFDMNAEIQQHGKIHFFGGPPNWMKWQNVAWIVELKEAPISFMAKITRIRERYNQDSIFVLWGEGQFI